MLLNNRYEVIRRLGEGGFGETFLAEDTNLPSRRQCVVKKLKPADGIDVKEAQMLFAREAQTLEALGKGSNGRVPELYAYFLEGRDFYLVMEYIEGDSLERKVSRTGPLSESEVWGRLLRELLATLEYVHARKVIHRDIKPANIIIRSDGLPVLIDYGIVKRQLTTMAGGGQHYAKSRVVTGTEGYTPDEQWKGKAVYASDLYALGMTAIFALTGKSPTELHDLETGDFAWHEHAPQVSRQLAGVLDKAVKENYKERFANAREMIEALDQSRPEAERTTQRPPTESPLPVTRAAPMPATPETDRSSASTIQAPPPKPAVPLPVKPPQPRGTNWVLVSVVGILLIGLVAVGINLTGKSNQPTTSETPSGSTPTASSSIKNSLGMEFVLIPAGEFQMGSTQNDDEKPVHKVKISEAFYLGKYEVTQAEWQAVMGNNPSNFKGNNLPVENVSWEECQEFIKKLNGKGEGVYRLPTEAEWEYACRAGTTGDYAGNLDEMGWYGSNSENKTHPVGQKKPNGWGVYDMHGNVWEWCEDWYDEGYYGKSPNSDPKGPSAGSYRVNRGGGWSHTAVYCRSATRSYGTPGNRSDDLGFRLLRTAR